MKQKTVGHALVIGGSGMLREASLWLTHQGYSTSVIGRNRSKLDSLAAEHSSIFPLSVDYTHLPDLKNIIRESITSHGVFDIIVAWIHNDQEKVLNVILQEIERVSDKSWQLYHVLGSSDNVDEIKNGVRLTSNCHYYQIQLGFKMENGHSRWLTNSEIATGVIESIENKTNVLVGQLEPWEMRP